MFESYIRESLKYYSYIIRLSDGKHRFVMQ